MKWTDSEITPFLHSRYGYLLMSLTAVAAVTYAAFSTVLPVIDTPVLTGFAHASEWIHDKPLQLLGGIVLAVATSLLLVGVNKQYNVVRGLSLLYAALYLVFTAATPVIMANLSGGAVMAVVWLVSLIPLFFSESVGNAPCFHHVLYCVGRMPAVYACCRADIYSGLFCRMRADALPEFKMLPSRAYRHCNHFVDIVLAGYRGTGCHKHVVEAVMAACKA